MCGVNSATDDDSSTTVGHKKNPLSGKGFLQRCLKPSEKQILKRLLLHHLSICIQFNDLVTHLLQSG